MVLLKVMKKQHLKLSEADKQYLTEFLSQGEAKVRAFKRATALLSLDRGATLQSVADALDVEHWTVSTWRNQYLESGLAFLRDKARSGRPAVIDGEQRAKITALACSETPAGHAKWSLRLLADKAVELELCENLSHMQAGRILKKTNFSRT